MNCYLTKFKKYLSYLCHKSQDKLYHFCKPKRYYIHIVIHPKEKEKQ